MHSLEPAPFGDSFFQAQKKLWGFTAEPNGWGRPPTRREYEAAREAALADPEYDFFDNYMPTGRSKHDIGRYALRHGVRVPLITNMEQLHEAARDSTILIRSDGSDEYSGPSGLRGTYPLGRVGVDGTHYGRHIQPDDEEELILAIFNGAYGSLGRQVSPEGVLELNRLATDLVLAGEMYPGAQFGMTVANSSLWRYIDGDNIQIMRDPVQEDLYHFRWGEYVSSKVHRGSYEEGYPVFRTGNGTAKHWQRTLDAGGNVEEHWFGARVPSASSWMRSAGLETLPDGSWQNGDTAWVPSSSGLPEFWAPINEVIDTYEKVRTLPLFDQRQVPVMEMQYNRKRGELHFLQYLKTGRILQHLDAFELPTGPSVVRGNDVVGATSPEGERMRIHVGVSSRNAQEAVKYVKGEGVLLPTDMILGGGGYLQSLALESRAAFIDYLLTFHNHHFGSAMFTRTPLSVGLLDWTGGKIGERLLTAHAEYSNTHQDNSIGYVNAIVTSNGREVTVESDWATHRADAS